MKTWIDRWAADAERRGLAARYVEQQRKRWAHLVAFTGDDPGTADIRRWLEHLGEVGIARPQGGCRPCGSKTLNNHLWGVRAVFQHAAACGLISTDPTAGVANARIRRKKQRALTPDEAWSMFVAAEADERSARPECKAIRSPYYRVLMATGMRAAAAASLRVGSFELDASPPRIVVDPESDKQREEREAVITAEDAAYFRAAFAGLLPLAPAVHRPRWHVIQRDVKAAGIKEMDGLKRRIGLHSFRRMVGSEIDRAGYSREMIRMRLGHRDIRSADPYIVRQVEEQQEVAENLGQRMRKKSTFAVDTGHGIADDVGATADTQSSESPDSNGSRLPARPLSQAKGGEPPFVSGPIIPGGQAGSDGSNLPEEPGSGKWAIQGSNLHPNPPAGTETIGAIVALYQRQIDHLDSLTKGSPQGGTRGTEQQREPD